MAKNQRSSSDRLNDSFDYRGKTVLVTGASSGIGKAFAHAFAGRGANVILVARSEQKLRDLAAELSRVHGVAANVIVADLERENAAGGVKDGVNKLGLSVDVLVNNAGFGTHGRFEALEPEREHAQVMLNVVAVADLTHAFLPAMTARGHGAIINVASTAAFQPDPYMATYGATKAFVLSFSEALWAENRRTGVAVLALCAGATATNFTAVVGTDDVVVGTSASAEGVVQEALRALARGRSSVITGSVYNRLLATLPRLLPRQTTARIVARVLRPRSQPTTERTSAGDDKTTAERFNA